MKNHKSEILENSHFDSSTIFLWIDGFANGFKARRELYKIYPERTKKLFFIVAGESNGLSNFEKFAFQGSYLKKSEGSSIENYF